MADPEGNEFCVCQLESEAVRAPSGETAERIGGTPTFVRPPEGAADLSDEEKMQAVRRMRRKLLGQDEGDDVEST